jgi:hypothetical protein
MPRRQKEAPTKSSQSAVGFAESNVEITMRPRIPHTWQKKGTAWGIMMLERPIAHTKASNTRPAGEARNTMSAESEEGSGLGMVRFFRKDSSSWFFRALVTTIALSVSGLHAFALPDTKVRVDIPAQDLGSALKAFSAAANEQVLFSDGAVAGYIYGPVRWCDCEQAPSREERSGPLLHVPTRSPLPTCSFWAAFPADFVQKRS